jgi:hypothetical protein
MEAIKERKPNIVWEVFDSNFQIMNDLKIEIVVKDRICVV